MKIVLKNYSILWLTALVGTGIVAILLTINKNLEVPNILNIEFSDSLSSFQHLASGQEGNLRANTLFDFLFILAYTLLFLLSLKVSALSLQIDLKKRYYLLCLLPGLFDGGENFFLLNLLEHWQVLDFERFYSAVRLKWALVIPFILMVLTILLYYALLLLGKVLALFFGISKYPLSSNKP